MKKHGVKLGFMSFFIKASAHALQEQPILNAVIDGKEIVYRDYVDVSVAVATPSGLMVPVVRNAEKQGFADIEKVLNQNMVVVVVIDTNIVIVIEIIIDIILNTIIMIISTIIISITILISIIILISTLILSIITIKNIIIF